MKYINTSPKAMAPAPEIIIHFGPNLSESHPANANVVPFCSVLIPGAIDAPALLRSSSAAIGLKRAENP